MQRKTWYSILGLDAKPLSTKFGMLMVSHGLTIRQLIKIFFQEFGCVSKVPEISDPTALLAARKFRETCLNTSWSKFVIEVSGKDYKNIKSVECHEVFNDKHLKELN